MTSFSRLPEFIKGSNAFKMQLKIEDKPLEAAPTVQLQHKGRQEIFPKQFYTVDLPPVFSHMSFLLIETLSATQHGEFMTRSRQGKYETIIELSGHISHRYNLNPQELEEIQKIYDQIIDNWIFWRNHRKKS